MHEFEWNGKTVTRNDGFDDYESKICTCGVEQSYAVHKSPILPKESGDPPIPEDLTDIYAIAKEKAKTDDDYLLDVGLIERLGAAEQQCAEAIALLNPACASENLLGAIRNLQQMAQMEHENAEFLESKLAAAEQSLAQMHESARLVQTNNEGAGCRPRSGGRGGRQERRRWRKMRKRLQDEFDERTDNLMGNVDRIIRATNRPGTARDGRQVM